MKRLFALLLSLCLASPAWAERFTFTKDAMSQTIMFSIWDSSSTTGGKLTGVAYNAAGLTCYYTRVAGTPTAITLATQTATGAYSSGGWVQVDATNAPGKYRLDVPNAVLATGVDRATIDCKGAANMVPVSIDIELLDINLRDSVRGGLTALPNAAAGANGGLPLGDASGDVTLASGTHPGVVIPTVTTVTNDVNVNMAQACPGSPTNGTVGDACRTAADSTVQTVDAATRLGKHHVMLTGANGVTTATGTTTTVLKTAYTGHGTNIFKNGTVIFETGPCGYAAGGAAGVTVTAYDSTTGDFTISGLTGCTPTAGGGDVFHVFAGGNSAVVAGVSGDVSGKVLGGGAGTITGLGVRSIPDFDQALGTLGDPQVDAIGVRVDSYASGEAPIGTSAKPMLGDADIAANAFTGSKFPAGWIEDDAYNFTDTISAKSAFSIIDADGSPDPITTNGQNVGWGITVYDQTTRRPKAFSIIVKTVAATNEFRTLTDVSALIAVGDYYALSPVDGLTSVIGSGTVVSSADCTNSAVLFDTDLSSYYSGTNGPREAGIRFTSGALINEIHRVGGFNVNGCVQVNQAYSGTPAAGDTFFVVTQ